ncbi:MAG: RNA polymerase sigma factor [Lachnospiraceae bacterium]|nr:RNA polymerase sigma factor [Lachnospiraceae bacterium]
MNYIDFAKDVEAARQGDTAAFEELYNNSVQLFRAAIYPMLKNEYDIEDVLQEAYVQIFKNLDNLEEPGAFIGWGRTICKNTALHHIRTAQRHWGQDDFRPSVSDDEYEGMDTLSVADERGDYADPQEQMDAAETKRLLDEMIGDLPEMQRLCIVLWQEGLTTAEIAERLAIPKGTVNSNVNYAKKKIKDKVLLLEKQGTKLYGLAPIPFFLWLMRQFEGQGVAALPAGSGAASFSAIMQKAGTGKTVAEGSAAGESMAGETVSGEVVTASAAGEVVSGEAAAGKLAVGKTAAGAAKLGAAKIAAIAVVSAAVIGGAGFVIASGMGNSAEETESAAVEEVIPEEIEEEPSEEEIVVEEIEEEAAEEEPEEEIAEEEAVSEADAATWIQGIYDAFLASDFESVRAVMLDEDFLANCEPYEYEEWAWWEYETAYRLPLEDGSCIGVIVYRYSEDLSLLSSVSVFIGSPDGGYGFDYLGYGDYELTISFATDGTISGEFYSDGTNEWGTGGYEGTLNPGDITGVWHM